MLYANNHFNNIPKDTKDIYKEGAFYFTLTLLHKPII